MKLLKESLRNVQALLRQLEVRIVEKNEKITGITFCPCDYKSGSAMPDLHGFKPFDESMTWGEAGDSHAWFHFTVSAPSTEELTLRLETEIDGWDSVNPQFICYVDGKIKQGLDTNHRTLVVSGKTEYDIFLYAYSGTQSHHLKLLAKTILENQDVKQLYYDILVPFESAKIYLDENSMEYQVILSTLDEALRLVDFLTDDKEAFLSSVLKARAYLQKEFYQKYAQKRQKTVVCIGHTHIDVAWMWTLEQTKEKAQRSFATVIELMKRYPEYKFMSSQAVLYQDVKEECPALYEEIKQMIKLGRWEVEGAMWVEADCNLISGESLVRQVQYGKNFFREEFGVESKILWLPDVFGYAAAIPQVLQKSGVEWFVTSKISWNDTNMMPYDIFRWKGIDGSEVNSYFITTQETDKTHKISNGTTYCPDLSSPYLEGTFNRLQQKNVSNEALLLFGFGDGGGGPTDRMLEILRRSEKGALGIEQTKIEFASEFLSNLEKEMNKKKGQVPSWQGELYLEFHRGTYTSQANNKKNNRKSEFLALDTEFLYTVLKRFDLAKFPKETLQNVWKTILTNQFHDIIPGSSIPQVYERSDRDYAEIFETLGNLRKRAFDEIANRIDKAGIVVFNPHSFIGSGVVKVDGVSAFVKNVPPKGYALVEPKTENGIVVHGKTVSSKFFTVKFDDNYEIVRLYDKKNHREVLPPKAKANRLMILQDYNDCYDAWELQKSSNDKSFAVTDVSNVKTVVDGCRTGISYDRTFQKSTVRQTVWFYEDLPKIDFETTVDWHQTSQLLKVGFPVDINADKATFEIQFGTIERPTHFNTSWDQAKFETCAHKYADLSEGNYGVSLLNDCKYGHDIHGNEMRLTLLKSALNPDNTGYVNDQGVHHFTYAIYPHKGNFASADTAKMAYDLNLPMSAYRASGNGTLPSSYSYVSCDRENVIVETVKEAEYSTDTVVRMYESKNAHTHAKIKFGFTPSEVYLCDLNEKPLKKLTVRGNAISLEIKPFEIVSLLVK